MPGREEPVSPQEARSLLEECGALLGGHFRLTSGLHSNRYVQKARVLERPRATVALAREMASWYRGVEVVVSPAVGAVVLGFAVALEAGARAIFAEREDGRMALRRGFALAPGERALVVEDVVTTGGSAGEVHDLVVAAGAEALGVAALVDRSTRPPPFPLRAVLRVEAPAWPPERCPLCRAGLPVEVPGSPRPPGPEAPGLTVT
jgi:orotate phosphoribosyltransferase